MVRIEELPTRSAEQATGAPSHAWSLAGADRLGRLEIVDRHDDDASDSSGGGQGAPFPHQQPPPPPQQPSFLDPREAERLVDGLETFGLEDVGSSRWLRQHQALERLNLQAHQSAQSLGQEEFVVEAFVSLDKIPTLIHALVLMDCWRSLLWPRLRAGVLAAGAGVRAYFVLYHEATVINLLEVLLFHGHACAAAGDALVDLVDYAAAHAALLNAGGLQREMEEMAATEEAELRAARALPDAAKRAEALARQRTSEETLRRQELMLRFQTAVAAVGVLRCLCAHAERDLPLPALGRLLQTHDAPLLLVPLIENPPWTRRRRSNNSENEEEEEGTSSSSGNAPSYFWEKYVDFAWRRVPQGDLLLLTKAEAQPWLALFHLLASPRVRARYHLHSFRKGQLLRVRRYLHDGLLDQLPVLADVRRFLDEASLLECPEPTAGPAAFLLEEVAAVRAAVLAAVPAGGKGKGEEEEEGRREAWCAAAVARQLEAHFVAHGGDARDEDLKGLAAVYGPKWVDAVLVATNPNTNTGTGTGTGGGGGIADTEEHTERCAHCGRPAAKRCGRCQRAWYCGRGCQVAAWKKGHRQVCEAAAAAVAAAGAVAQQQQE